MIVDYPSIVRRISRNDSSALGLQLKTYTLWGYIAADTLPDDIDFGRVRIKREFGEKLAELSKARPSFPKLTWNGSETYVSGTPADLVVRSDRFVWIRVDAANENDAYNLAIERYLPPVLGALAELTVGPVLVELVRVGEEDSVGYMQETRSPYTPASSIRGFQVNRMTAEECDDLRVRCTAVSRDETARRAARDLLEASRITYLSGGTTASLQAALLRYFFVIEHIARKIGYDGKVEDSIEEAQSKIVEKLRVALNREGQARKLVSKVQNASKDLQAAERRFLTAQIEHTGLVLELDNSQVVEALKLAKLRNARLGHAARTDIASTELEPHIRPAEAVARSFFNAYMKHVRGAV